MNIARILLAEHLKNVFEARLSETFEVDENERAGGIYHKAKMGGFHHERVSAHDSTKGKTPAEIRAHLSARGVPAHRLDQAVQAYMNRAKASAEA